MHHVKYFSFFFIFSMSLFGCENDTKHADFSTDSQFEQDNTLCNFHDGGCTQTVNNLIVQFTSEDPSAPSETPFALKFTFSDTVTDVNTELVGRDMFMGRIPVILNELGNNHYSGQAIYGSCASNYMVWRANIRFKYRGEDKFIWFDFLADNHK